MLNEPEEESLVGALNRAILTHSGNCSSRTVLVWNSMSHSVSPGRRQRQFLQRMSSRKRSFMPFATSGGFSIAPVARCSVG